MNRLLLNSGTLNGAIYGLVLATASVVCSANVGATGVRVAKAETVVTGVATVSPQATYTHNSFSSLLGEGGLFPVPTHQQQSSANLQGSSNVLVYVLRAINATASFTSSANIIAVVASSQGSSSLAGTVNVVATGTRLQPITSTLAAQANVSSTALLTRRPVAALEGQVFVRAEATKNRDIEGYVDSSGSGTVTAWALSTRPANAVVETQATSSAVGTLIQPGKVNASATGFIVFADPFVQATILSNIAGIVSVQATADITRLPIASLVSQATVVALPKQNHAAQSDCVATVSVLTGLVVTSPISANVMTVVTVEGRVIRGLVGVLGVAGTANISVVANSKSLAYSSINTSSLVQATAQDLNTRRVLGTSVVDTNTSIQAVSRMQLFLSATATQGSALMTVVADTAYRNAEALVPANANSIVANALVTKEGTATLLTGVDVVSLARRLLLTSAQLQGTGLVYADTIANPESYDPEERTFVRPFTEVNFVRPFIETEFKRAA